jgi:hypothetical protein
MYRQSAFALKTSFCNPFLVGQAMSHDSCRVFTSDSSGSTNARFQYDRPNAETSQA